MYRRLIDDLDIPFLLKDAQRLDESTPAHTALREALINALVHADYTDKLSVLIVKKQNAFMFRNPGGMRVSIEQAQQGGESDCRNTILHHMFLNVGLGEKAGSGVPKIYSGWKSCNWLPPKLYEKDEPASTCLELHMADLVHFPYDKLEALYGDQFKQLDEQDRMIIVFALSENIVTHARLAEVLPDIHPRDLSERLKKLTHKGFLKAHGKTRAMIYQVPDSEHLTSSSEHLTSSSEHFSRDEHGRLLVQILDAPMIASLHHLSGQFKQTLLDLAKEARENRKMAKKMMAAVLMKICTDHYVTLPVLAELLNRSPDALRQQYIKTLIKEGKIGLAFPNAPTNPRQAYKTSATLAQNEEKNSENNKLPKKVYENCEEKSELNQEINLEAGTAGGFQSLLSTKKFCPLQRDALHSNAQKIKP